MTAVQNTAETFTHLLGTDENGCPLYSAESAPALDARGVSYWQDADGLCHVGPSPTPLTDALEAAQAELCAAERAAEAFGWAGEAATILSAAGYSCSNASDSSRAILAVTSAGENEAAAEETLCELRAILGSDYDVEFTGNGDTWGDGSSTDDVRVELTGEAFDRLDDALTARVDAAKSAVVDARSELSGSDEPREWTLTEEAHDYDTITASSVEDALREARSNVDRSNYDGAEGTIWIDVRVHCELTGEELSGTVQLDEDEPDCEDGEEHDWQSPHSIVGGIEENPGVWGNGGGVMIHKVCMRCGCGRKTDTWAQRQDTGEQGFESVSYEPGEYADQIPTRAERELADISCIELRAGAAAVLSDLRSEYCAPRTGWTRRVRERAEAIVEHLDAVRSAAPVGGRRRALRLALRLAARDTDERSAAEAIISALGW